MDRKNYTTRKTHLSPAVLYHDASGAALPTIMERAKAWYRRFHSSEPNVCYTDPTALIGETVAAGVTVRTNNHVEPHYFWIGCEVSA